MNKVTFGLSRVHVAFLEDGKYSEPVHIPGAVSFTPTAVGDQSNFYADNGIYHAVNTNSGYTAEMSIALMPDEIQAKMLGWEIDENGALVEIADGHATPFALMFQINGDKHNRRHVYYNVMANRPAKEYSTSTESTEVNPDQLSMTITQTDIDGKNVIGKYLTASEENQEAYDTFFEGVYGMETTADFLD